MTGAPFTSLSIYTAATTTPHNNNITTTTTNQTQPPPLTKTTACFSLLCHVSRIGAFIGQSGSGIKNLQDATSSKILVLDAPDNSEYRVVSVVADSLVNRTLSFSEFNNNNNNNGLEGNEEESGGEYCEVSDAQEALVRVYERVLSVVAEADGCYFAPRGLVSCRLLAERSVVGFVIGKGGGMLQKFRKDTGCKIKVFRREKVPPCAMPNDEMIEIEGGVLAVKKALIAVARRIQDCPPIEKLRMAVGEPDYKFNREAMLASGYMQNFPPARPHNRLNHLSPNKNTDRFPRAKLGNRFNPMLPNRHMDFGRFGAEITSRNQHKVVFRILCSSECIGGVIGNSGSIVHALENETGALISASYPLPGCNDRLITITAIESPESHNSPAQNAVILVFTRSVERAYEKGFDSPQSGTPISARLVIPRSQMGCLLGKGGSIMEDMRKVTGAFIKNVNGKNYPECASETDEVVLMTGEFVNVRDALYSITGRLRNHIFTKGIKSFGRQSGQPPFEMHSFSASNQFDQQHTSLTQSMDDLSLFNNHVDHPSLPGPWQSQSGAGNSMNGHDVDRGSTSGKCGIELGRGGRSAVITSTTLEIMVPENDIGCVYGEDESNLTRLRQLSGAKVVVHEPASRNGDYVVVISGTPDQTQSAQSLLQAFILADQH